MYMIKTTSTEFLMPKNIGIDTKMMILRLLPSQKYGPGGHFGKWPPKWNAQGCHLGTHLILNLGYPNHLSMQ
jgi:hypothetical protein